MMFLKVEFKLLLRWIFFPRYLPSGRGHFARFVEYASLRTCKRKWLVGPNLAAFKFVAASRTLHDVVATIFVNRHTTLCYKLWLLESR